MRALIINHYSRNKGDQAILAFLLRELREHGMTRVTVSVSEPSLWRQPSVAAGMEIDVVPWGLEPWWLRWSSTQRHLRALWHHARRLALRYVFYPPIRSSMIGDGERTYWRRWVNAQFATALEHSDLVISTGGHHVTSWLAPECICWQTMDISMAILAGKPTVLWSQSFGPFDFDSPRNADFIRTMLSRASGLYARDKGSASELVKIGINREMLTSTHDSVMGLQDPNLMVRIDERDMMAGISIYAARKRTAHEQREYVAAIAATADHLIRLGYAPTFFPMEMKAETKSRGGDDRPLIQTIVDHTNDPDQCKIVQQDMDTLEHLSAVSRCRLFIGHKTHSVVFALITGTPILAIAYHQKTAEFMRACGLDAYCVSDQDLSPASLCERVDAVRRSAQEISNKAIAATTQMVAQVRSDFAHMLEAAEPKHQ